ncbi:HigA family addiction module antitoxin [Acaryochloris sp. IP29b_bin.148]|uniref:HigA family addiction module antitoxin n=1 Tax=Acaryochloris sp. IP29b_bin.148 TaxID=2969218 RepID=UPI002636CAC0|nr:HigA family addiction module antitoxin [Acaryochloris sp. IP29b_bin.148]
MLMHNPPHPGEVIQGLFIKPNDLTLTDVAKALNVSPSNFSRLINGKIALSSDMAVRLSRVLGLEPLTWMRMQADYDIWNVQQQDDHAELKRLVGEA